MADYIDLGSKPEESIAAPSKGPSIYYPHITITGPEEIGLSGEGEAMIRYKEVESSNSTRNGKKQYRCELEVMSIKPMGKGKSSPMEKPKGKSFSEALDEAQSGGESGEYEKPGTMDD